MFFPKRYTKAFTLLELIVVIIILGILAAIAIPTFIKAINKSHDETVAISLLALGKEASALAAQDGADSFSSDGKAFEEAASDFTLKAQSTGVSASGTPVVVGTDAASSKGDAVKVGVWVASDNKSALLSLTSQSKNCVGVRVSISGSGKKEAGNCVTGTTTGGGTTGGGTTGGGTTGGGTTGGGTNAAGDGNYTSSNLSLTGTNTVLASNLLSPYRTVFYNDYLYFAERGNGPGTGKISRISKNGGPVELVSAVGGIDGLTRMGNFFYYTHTQSQSIYRVPVTGGTPVVLGGLSIGRPTGISSDGTALYVSMYQSGEILRITVDASGVASSFVIAQNLGRPIHTVNDNQGNIYYADGRGNVYKMTLSASNPNDLASTPQLIAPFGGEGNQMVIAGNTLYVSIYNEPSIAVNLTTGATTELFASESITGLATDGTRLYYADITENTVGKLE